MLDAFDDPLRILTGGLGKDEEELVSAEASEKVVVAQVGGDGERDLAKSFVAGSVAAGSLMALKWSMSISAMDGPTPLRLAQPSSMASFCSMPRRLSAPETRSSKDWFSSAAMSSPLNMSRKQSP